MKYLQSNCYYQLNFQRRINDYGKLTADEHKETMSKQRKSVGLFAPFLNLGAIMHSSLIKWYIKLLRECTTHLVCILFY